MFPADTQADDNAVDRSGSAKIRNYKSDPDLIQIRTGREHIIFIQK